MFFFLFVAITYITKWAILAQMLSFYLESYRRKDIMLEQIKQDDDKEDFSKGQIMDWMKYSWGCYKKAEVPKKMKKGKSSKKKK